MAHESGHRAVGASTAAFGAVGLLVALRLISREAMSWRKRWTAPVAGVVLLLMLGASHNADLTAHAMGFVLGMALGFAAGLIVRRRSGPIVQWLLGALAATIVVVCWHLALRT